MCEEVRHPATQVPRAIVGGLALNALAGFAFLIPIAFVLPDVGMLAALASGQPVPTIILSATGNSAGAFCLLIPLLVLGLICGIGCVTATSRITWAFARDGAIPGSGWWKSVNERLEIPLNSLVLGMVIELLLGLIYFGSSAAFNAFSGVGVIFLTMSYACPVAVSLILRKRQDLKRGSYNLGVLGAFCNVVCIGKWMKSSIHSSHPFLTGMPSLAWCLLAIPLFSMPTSIPVSKDTMNYACVVFVGFVAISGLWYAVWGKKNYIGPALEEIDGQIDSQAGDHSDIDIAPNK
jgi:amino acid transporter